MRLGQALQYEIAREREQGRRVERIRITERAILGSPAAVPFGDTDALLLVSLARHCSELLVHPDDFPPDDLRLEMFCGIEVEYEVEYE